MMIGFGVYCLAFYVQSTFAFISAGTKLTGSLQWYDC